MQKMHKFQCKSMDERLAQLENRCKSLEAALLIQDRWVSGLRAGINANTIAMYGVLSAIGYNEWVQRCVNGRLDHAYEGLHDHEFTQEECDAFDMLASRFRHCMTESKEAVEAVFGSPERE